MKIIPETCFLLLASLFVSCASDIVNTTGSVHGTITDNRTGEAIAGASVSITPGSKSLQTGADGNYSFLDMESKEYTIQVTKDGYKSNSKAVIINPGDDLQNDIQLEPADPVLTVSKNSLDFGSTSTTLTLDIGNTGLSVLKWQITEDISWLSCNPQSGTVTVGSSASVIVSVSRSSLERGDYTQTIAISSNGGSQIVNVSMNVL